MFAGLRVIWVILVDLLVLSLYILFLLGKLLNRRSAKRCELLRIVCVLEHKLIWLLPLFCVEFILLLYVLLEHKLVWLFARAILQISSLVLIALFSQLYFLQRLADSILQIK